MSPTNPVFFVAESTTFTSRTELAGIPIIYHQTGILSIVGVNLKLNFESTETTVKV